MNGPAGNGSLTRTGLSVLAAAVSIYVAVRLIDSVAVTLIVIVTAISGLIIVGFVIRLLWRRHHMNRW
jgi:hypothetical protein